MTALITTRLDNDMNLREPSVNIRLLFSRRR